MESLLKKPTRKSLHKKLWDLQSKEIRSKAADFSGYAECYTCRRKYQWKEMDVGHRFHNKLDFDKRNLKPQCVRCNKWLHGASGEYTARLIEDFGMEWYKQLERDAHQHKGYSLKELNLLNSL